MDVSYRLKELSDQINMMKSEISELKTHLNNDDLWDSSDIIRHWKISVRTLATWRSEGLIDYVQVGSKIWYTKESRDAFLMKNLVRAKYSAEMLCSN